MKRGAGWVALVVVVLAAREAEAVIAVTGSAADQMAWNQLLADCSKDTFFKMMLDEINASAKSISVKLVRSKKDVSFDSYATGEIDLDDLGDLPPLDPPHTEDRCEITIHILWERFYHACHPAT